MVHALEKRTLQSLTENHAVHLLEQPILAILSSFLWALTLRYIVQHAMPFTAIAFVPGRERGNIKK
eukprot:2781758-Pyramimonas_sp.AAC.1